MYKKFSTTPVQIKRTTRISNYVIGENFVSLGEIVLIIGPTSIGKTVFATDFAYDLAAGRNLYGNVPVLRPVKTLLVLLEYNAEDQADLKAGIRKHSSFSKDSQKTISKSLYFDDDFSAWSGKEQYFKELQKAVNEHYEAIVIDNINRLYVNRSRIEQVKEFINESLKIIKGKAALFLVTHQGKRLAEKYTSLAHESKGLSEWGDSARSTFNLNLVSNVEGVIELRYTKNANKLGEKFKDTPFYLSYSESAREPYYFEIRYTPRAKEKRLTASQNLYADYHNLGFNFLPMSIKHKIEEYIKEIVQGKLNALLGKSVTTIWDGIRKDNRYIHVVTLDDLNKFDELFQRFTALKTSIQKSTDKARKLGINEVGIWFEKSKRGALSGISSETLWIGNDFLSELEDKLDRLDSSINSHYMRPFAITPYDSAKWETLGVHLRNK